MIFSQVLPIRNNKNTFLDLMINISALLDLFSECINQCVVFRNIAQTFCNL